MIGSVKAIADWIRANDDIAVIVHFRPDGDAYGSALALALAIQALGKRAFPACDDAVEDKYAFLPAQEQFCNKDNMPFVPKAALGADVSNMERMGKLAEVFGSCKEQAILDHHASNGGFGGACCVVPDASSTGELVLQVIEALGLELTEDMALNAYVAMSTDTGNFSFQCTAPTTYRSAAKCLEAGVNVEDVTRRLYRTRTLKRTRLLGRTLDNIETYAEDRIALIRLTKEMFAETGTDQTDAHSIVNYLNEIVGVRIGILAEETAKGVKFSFRAAGGTNVAALAAVFGGGGHVAAAGATIDNVTMDEIVPKVIAEAVKYV